MNKKTIILRNSSTAIPTSDFWRPRFEKYFNIERMQLDKKYDARHCIFWGSSPENVLEWIEPYLEQGFPVVLDYLWDHFGYSHEADNVLILKSNNFIFANEVLNYKFWNYHNKNFKRQADKFFLCLMNQQRDHRDQIFDAIQHYKDESYISYLHKNIQVQGDVIQLTGNGEWTGSSNWQRYLNTDWYNNTNFSLVVETTIHDPRFYSEKILKTFAFKHPLIVWGAVSILGRVKQLGFESFDHIVDESYDSEENNDIRLKKILDQVELLYKEFSKNKNLFNDKLTLEKIEHNYNLFYDETLLDNIIEKEIMQPLLAFAYE